MPKGLAKEIRVAPIIGAAADALVKRIHYSGKVVHNSQLHLGVFLKGRLEGAMQFGPSMVKRNLIGLVKGTAWNGFLELNRMAFSDQLPRNSESRALGIAMRMIRKHYPHVEWVISFADGAQCGDGTIYRAAGFVLTGIKRNSTMLEFPDGTRIADLTLSANWNARSVVELCRRMRVPVKARPISEWRAMGAKKMEGYQLRYIRFLNPAARDRLAVPVIPFERIDELGAGMYLGERVSRSDRRPKQAMAGNRPAQRRGSADLDAPNSHKRQESDRKSAAAAGLSG